MPSTEEFNSEHGSKPSKRRFRGDGAQYLEDLLYKNDSFPPRLPKGRRRSSRRRSIIKTNSDWIDIDSTILAWLRTCNTRHGNHCRSSQPDLSPQTRPIWLIDVEKWCLVPFQRDHQYLALSYVWSHNADQDSHFETLEGNLSKLQEEYAFKKYRDRIPTTVLHVMELSKTIGERYLWVDRFCIVQDDEESKELQINNMAYIYSAAYVTIVAAVGDAETGLRGIPGISPCFEDPNRDRTPEHTSLMAASAWSKRAWTMQEVLFSGRAIFLFKDAITWECHCKVWYEFDAIEQTGNTVCYNRYSAFANGLQYTLWPDLEEYAQIVKGYSTRQVTRIEDTLPAFAGITTALTRTFTDGFLHGLPAMFFDIALLWRPGARIERKIVSKKAKSGLAINALPSWSWAGWDFGDEAVDLVLWWRSCDYILHSKRFPRRRVENGQSRDTSIMPCIDWKIGRHIIRNQAHEYRGTASCSLPGWIFVENEGFRHVCDPLATFKYPIAIKMASQTPTEANLRAVSLPPFLVFRTSRAFLDTRPYCMKGRKNQKLSIGHIYSKIGEWCGHFRSHDERLSLSNTLHPGGTSSSEKLEFIAISWGHERNTSSIFDESFIKQYRKEDGRIEFFNVLWIEWVEGIAYRRGLGHVVKEIWEGEMKERVDVILG